MEWMSRRDKERGTAALEFALVLPVLLLVVLSMIDFGRYLYVRVSLSSASMEVANAVSRGLITDQDTMATKQAKIQGVINDVSPSIASFAQLNSTAQLTLDPLPNPCPNSSNATTVQISTSFQSISPIQIFFTSANGSTTIRCLR